MPLWCSLSFFCRVCLSTFSHCLSLPSAPPSKGQAAAAASSDEGPAVPTAKDVCAAYCSLAEIYLSDLWYGWESTVWMHEHCLDAPLTAVLSPCVHDLAAWRKERRTNVESVSRAHYSTTATAQRLCSSWPVTCSAQSETRSASTHTHAHARAHARADTHTHTRACTHTYTQDELSPH